MSSKSASRNGIEALLFDLGGVLVDIDFGRALRSWAVHSSLDVAELDKRFAMDLPYEQHERGELSGAEYFSHLRELLELDATDAEIAAGWNDIFLGVVPQTMSVLQQMSSNIPCYLFSNSNPTHQLEWSQAYPEVIDACEQVFVSSDIGLRKPEAEAFAAVITAMQVDPAATLFFDDTPENVEGARACGLQAVHIASPQDVERALRDHDLA